MKMFGKESCSAKNGISLISRDLKIEGAMFSQSTLEIEGKIEGDIIGNIVSIRESGEVEGSISANVLNIKGRFNGKIKSEKINISKKSKIKASMEYCFLCVEDGAIIEGDLKRVEKVKIIEGVKIQQDLNKKEEIKNNKV